MRRYHDLGPQVQSLQNCYAFEKDDNKYLHFLMIRSITANIEPEPKGFPEDTAGANSLGLGPYFFSVKFESENYT